VILTSNRTENIQRRIYCGLQIFGAGLFVMNWLNAVESGRDAVTLLALVVLAGVGVTGGLVAIFYLEGKRQAGRWCMYFWALQIPTFACDVASFRFLAGSDLRIGMKLSPPGLFFDLQLGYGLIARVGQEGPLAYFGLNVLAVAAVIFFLHKGRRQLRAQCAP